MAKDDVVRWCEMAFSVGNDEIGGDSSFSPWWPGLWSWLYFIGGSNEKGKRRESKNKWINEKEQIWQKNEKKKKVK